MIRYVFVFFGLFLLTVFTSILFFIIGMSLGGNYFTQFEMFGVRGYEATGLFGFFLGIIIGVFLSIIILYNYVLSSKEETK